MSRDFFCKILIRFFVSSLPIEKYFIMRMLGILCFKQNMESSARNNRSVNI